MSEYLGWRERKPPVSQRSKFDRDVIPGGPMTHNYEDYVKSVFDATRPKPPPAPVEKSSSSGGSSSSILQNQNASEYADTFEHGYGIEPLTSFRPQDNSVPIHDDKYYLNNSVTGLSSKLPQHISASTMLRMEQELGHHALDESNDDSFLDKSPLEKIYEEMGIKGLEQKNYRNYQVVEPKASPFQVYEPKSSAEYFHTMHSNPNPQTAPTNYRGTFRSYKPVEDSWKKNDRQFLVDYKDVSTNGSIPLSPYMYLDHPYVRSQDSRIVGSNFVQMTTRPRDSFLDKIDKTLAEVRALPRY